MPSLQTRIDSLATDFVKRILDAIGSASVEELVGSTRQSGTAANSQRTPALPGPPGARMARRSPEEVERAVDKIVLLVKSHRDGMRAEQIRSAFGLQASEMPRILKHGIATKRLTAKGEKRATRYSAA